MTLISEVPKDQDLLQIIIKYGTSSFIMINNEVKQAGAELY